VLGVLVALSACAPPQVRSSTEVSVPSDGGLSASTLDAGPVYGPWAEVSGTLTMGERSWRFSRGDCGDDRATRGNFPVEQICCAPTLTTFMIEWHPYPGCRFPLLHVTGRARIVRRPTTRVYQFSGFSLLTADCPHGQHSRYHGRFDVDGGTLWARIPDARVLELRSLSVAPRGPDVCPQDPEAITQGYCGRQ